LILQSPRQASLIEGLVKTKNRRQAD